MRLDVDNLKVSYGLSIALKGFSLRVEDGQAVPAVPDRGEALPGGCIYRSAFY